MIDIEPELIVRVQAAVEDVRAGKMIILVDDEDRENEGDLTMAAEKVTAEAVNFMAKHGRGLICLTLTEEQVERLELPMMQLPKWRGGPPLGTAFTVSIEASRGVTTGISAHDRALTIRVASSPDARPEDIVTPGHIFPLKARTGGVLVRTGQTEGSVDLARLADLTPAGVICEIMNDDGTMARMPDLERFSADHGLKILSIADLIRYRLQTERLVRRVAEKEIKLDRTGTPWKVVVFDTTVEDRQFLALIKGDLSTAEPVLTRMHAGSLVADLFSSTRFEGGSNLREAIDLIEREGRGVVVYLPTQSDLRGQLEKLLSHHNDPGRPPDPSSPIHEVPAEAAAAHQGALRHFGLGAQILAELGVHNLRLLTNNPRKIAGIEAYGLHMVETVPLVSMRDAG